jgi:TonB family protein
MLATMTAILALSWTFAKSPGEKLLEEAKRGRTSSIQKLVVGANALDINYRDENGWTALFYAIRGGHEKTAFWLLEHGASPRRTTADGESALIVATQYRRQAILRRLLSDQSLDVETRDVRGWSAHTWAVFLRFDDGIDLLRGAGAMESPPTGPLPFLRALDEGVIVPTVKKSVQPSYTDGAMDRQVQGEVVIDIVIRKDGTPLLIGVSRSLDPELDRKAMEAASEWLFEPATLNGTPVDMVGEIVVRFNILERRR